MKILNVVGARPNFVKIAPIIEEMSKVSSISPYLVHSGQHYDYQMSRAFFEDLNIPDADINLGIKSGTHAEQTGQILIAFEKVCKEQNPDLIIVVGDVNSTIACTLAAKKLGIPVAHVEAGLRSGDMSMPEEINRRCTDSIADYFFTTEISAKENLLKEGVDKEAIFFVGNVMIDTLFKHKKAAAQLQMAKRLDLEGKDYAVLTLHRPSNTDNKTILSNILKAIANISNQLPIVFPIHPRTKKSINHFNLEFLLKPPHSTNLLLIEPLRYLEFIGLLQDARMVLTDSGGLQEETTALGIPCLTMRENTERPITCKYGTNKLVGNDTDLLTQSTQNILAHPKPKFIPIEKWDGKAAERIIKKIQSMF